VPEAIICFLESHDFLSAIRNAIYIGGDSDTIAAMAASIAEAYYGIPSYIEEQMKLKLPEDFKEVIYKFNENMLRR
jgi:ADP-ribosylglycohydrolase